MKKDEMILSTSDEAAQFKTVTGWVSRHGLFFGDNERTARYDGATHVPCSECGQPVERNWIKCRACREKDDLAKFLACERRAYEGGMLYSDARRCYFRDADELLDYIASEGVADVEDLRVMLCEPVYPSYLDDDHWCDELPEDCTLDDVAGDLADAVAKLNDVIRQMHADNHPLSWTPSKFALDLSSIPAPEGGTPETKA